jgi:hypothetical protein
MHSSRVDKWNALQGKIQCQHCPTTLPLEDRQNFCSSLSRQTISTRTSWIVTKSSVQMCHGCSWDNISTRVMWCQKGTFLWRPNFSTLGPCRSNECCEVSVYVTCGRFSVDLEMIITLNYVRIICRGWGISHCSTQRATDLQTQILILQKRTLTVMNVNEPTTQ